MTLRCVPVGVTDAMLLAALSQGSAVSKYDAMLTAAPPPPPDIAGALELAKTMVDEEARGRVLPSFGKVASALLKSWGRE